MIIKLRGVTTKLKYSVVIVETSELRSFFCLGAAMKLLIFAATLVTAACVAAKPRGPAEKRILAQNEGPALSNEDIVKRGEWSTLSKMVNGRQLLFGCDRRHTLSDDGKCWSYCGADWVSILQQDTLEVLTCIAVLRTCER